MVDTLWPRFKKDRRVVPARPGSTPPPSEDLPRGLFVYALDFNAPAPGQQRRHVRYVVGRRGRLFEPGSRERSPKRMLPGSHWLVLHRNGNIAAGDLDALATSMTDVARYAAYVFLAIDPQHPDLEPVIELTNPYLEAVVSSTRRRTDPTGHPIWPEAPVSEGFDHVPRWAYMSSYQPGYTPDYVARGFQLGFRVVIQHDSTSLPATIAPDGTARNDASTGQTVADIRRDLQAQLFEPLQAILAEAQPPSRGAAADAAARELARQLADPGSPIGVRLIDTRIGTTGPQGNDGQRDPWGEDNKWLTRGNGPGAGLQVIDGVQIVYTPRLRSDEIADASVLNRSRGYHAIEGPPEFGSFHGAVSERDLGQAAHRLGEGLSRPRRQTRVYIEGGNMLVGSRPGGAPYALVGYDSLVVSWLRMNPANTNTPAAERLHVRDVELCWAHLRREGAARRAEHQAMVADLRTAETARVYPPSSDVQRGVRAWNVLARLEATRLQMMLDLSVGPDDLQIIEQLDFHNDMHMRPLAPGVVLVNDFDHCSTLLHQLVDHPTATWPPVEERQTLRDMLVWSDGQASRYRALTQQIADQCEAIGLTVVRCPGVFRTNAEVPSTPEPGRTRPGAGGVVPWPFHRWANFMNAAPGTTPPLAALPAATPGATARLAEGTTYYLTNASAISSLQRAFADWLRDPSRHLGVTKVAFLGGAIDAGNPLDQAVPGMRPGITLSERSLDLQGGLDCRQSCSSSNFAERDLPHETTDPDAQPAPVPTATA